MVWTFSGGAAGDGGWVYGVGGDRAKSNGTRAPSVESAARSTSRGCRESVGSTAPAARFGESVGSATPAAGSGKSVGSAAPAARPAAGESRKFMVGGQLPFSWL